jgi:hypothetical protein
VSQLDEACNIPEAYAIAKSVAQQQRTSRIFPSPRSSWLFVSLLAALFLAPLPALPQLYTGSVTPDQQSLAMRAQGILSLRRPLPC